MDATTARRLLESELDDLIRVGRAERAVVSERGDELLEREGEATILRLTDERTADVAHALRKLDAGTYGACETCGAPIPDDRLRARPDARFCEADERAWERRQIAFDVGAGAAADERGDPAWAELDGLDDDLLEREVLSAEEAAVHEASAEEI